MAKQTILKRLLKGLKTRFMGLLLPVLALSILLFSLPSGAFAWGTGITYPSSPVYGQSNPYIYTETALSNALFINSMEIGSRHWNCGGSEHNVGYITIENRDTDQIYATSSQFNQYCGGWDNPDNLAVSFAGEYIPGSTIIEVKIYYTTWVGDNGYGGFTTNSDEVPSLLIQYPGEYASTTGSFSPGWSILNTIPGATNTGLKIWPTLAPTQTQSIEIAETGSVLLPDSFVYTPAYYQAQAYAKAGSTILATSSIRNFSFVIPEDITTSTDYSQCDTEDSSWSGRAFCRSMIFLFTPDRAILNNFTNLSARAGGVMPFSMFTQIKSALMIGATSTDQLISTSTLSAFSIFGTFKTGLGVILWLIFAFWAIRALRQIQH